MADAPTAHQLVEGFHDLEEGSWRWTKGHFAVLLLAPAGSQEKGATLRFEFAIPEAAFEKYGAQRISVKVGAATLPSQAFKQPGTFELKAEVPAQALRSDLVLAEFSLAKTFTPLPDQRELGVVARQIALETK